MSRRLAGGSSLMVSLALALTLGATSMSPASSTALAESGVGATAQRRVIDLPLKRAIRRLPVAAETPTGYDRDLFHLWIDADHDCQDTRDEVLAAESEVPVSGCDITEGRWTSYYNRETWTDSGDVDIDHLVALGEAWDSGAKRWTYDTRERYANDLGDRRTLVAVTDNVNASKSDKDPSEWLPEFSRCRYAREWTAIKLRWSLTVDTTERATLLDLASHCPGARVRVKKASVTLSDARS